MKTDRRKFIELLGAGALSAAYAESIRRALAVPAHHRTGTIEDVEHIVILMQENRSFDHYFGTLRGVRGFDDPRAVKLPSGKPVWHQSDGEHDVLPFRPAAPDLGMAFLEGTPHSYADTQGMWNLGNYDRWIPFKGRTAMAHFERQDIPFHFALADAFSVCDAYHCSFMGSTDPNRYHLWTGWTGNDGTSGGPVLDNAQAVYDWKTYPERLLESGVTWKIYQDAGAGLSAANNWGWGADPYVGNFGNNSLLHFQEYQNAQLGSDLHQAAFNATHATAGDTLFAQFANDVASGNLPQVSWIIAPEAYSEHPNWPANYGAWYVSQMLDALTAHPEVWSKTVFFLVYDENDGFFDHVVPPTPHFSQDSGASTIDTSHEVFPGDARFVSGPFGLGQRVPMIAISPWSKGGWVNSQVFDHTSLIRFIERRFGVYEPNITPWRRAITGDLTSVFDFRSPETSLPALPDTTAFAPPDRLVHASYVPEVSSGQAVPRQERGVRPARALPYRLAVHNLFSSNEGSLSLSFDNLGAQAAVFQVRAGLGDLGPWSFTVGAQARLTNSWPIKGAAYDFAVYGPNGFYRAYKGSLESSFASNLAVRSSFESGGITLHIENRGATDVEFEVWDAYLKAPTRHTLLRHSSATWHWSLERSFGWYDLTLRVLGDVSFEQQLAGHLEDGQPSMSDPALGAPSLFGV